MEKSLLNENLTEVYWNLRLDMLEQCSTSFGNIDEEAHRSPAESVFLKRKSTLSFLKEAMLSDVVDRKQNNETPAEKRASRDPAVWFLRPLKMSNFYRLKICK